MNTWIGLTLAFVSALVVNVAYSLEHDAAARLPPLRPSKPIESVRLLLGDRPWLLGFATETAGWLVYLAALHLAPLALVQAVTASGIAVLAFASGRGPARLTRREQVAVAVSLIGLTLLALSLVGTAPADRRPGVIAVVVWLAACGGGALLLVAVPTRIARVASLGLATGLLFSIGDMSAKLLNYGGFWLAAVAILIAAYAAGTTLLQSAYQHGDALTAAGTATLVTNAVPIAAGFLLFGEELPRGAGAAAQIAAFAFLVAAAAALAPRARRA